MRRRDNVAGIASRMVRKTVRFTRATLERQDAPFPGTDAFNILLAKGARDR